MSDTPEIPAPSQEGQGRNDKGIREKLRGAREIGRDFLLKHNRRREVTAPRPTPEQDYEASLFPIGNEATHRALAAIEQGRDQVMDEESKDLQGSNPMLKVMIEAFATRSPMEGYMSPFTEGALLSHRIFREKSRLTDSPIPQISLSDYQTHLKNLSDEIDKVGEAEGAEAEVARWNTAFSRRMKAIAEQDPAFGEIIETLARDTYHPDAFIQGATFNYSLIREAVEKQKLEKQL